LPNGDIPLGGGIQPIVPTPVPVEAWQIWNEPNFPSCSLLDQREQIYKNISDVMPPDADFINWSIR